MRRRETPRNGSGTAIEAVYVPDDDFTDPAVTTIAAHIDSMIVLSRQMAAEGMYPAIDPIASSSILLDPLVLGAEHTAVATEVRRNIEHYRELQGRHLAARHRGAPRRGPAHCRAGPASAAVSDSALYRDGSFFRRPRSLGRGWRHYCRMQSNPRRRMRRVAGKFPLYGRHFGRGARQGKGLACGRGTRAGAPKQAAAG